MDVDSSLRVLGFQLRRLDLIHGGRTFLRRRGVEHERLGGVLVHRIDAADPGLDLHDHPWPFITLVLRGGYTEEWASTDEAGLAAKLAARYPKAYRPGVRRSWPRWSIHRMPLDVAHRIVHAQPGTITLVLRTPKRREWGFYLPTGRVLWTEYDYESRRPLTVESNRPGETMEREP